jgi:hypothetical protein
MTGDYTDYATANARASSLEQELYVTRARVNDLAGALNRAEYARDYYKAQLMIACLALGVQGERLLLEQP